MPEKLKIQIVVGSVREGCVSLPVACWVHASAREQGGLKAELVDLADWPLPMFALATPPAMGGYKDPLQQRWAAKVGEADGYILVSPEYNHGTSAVLKNALDYLYAEWNRKPVAFVSFGNTGGARAVEQLRAIAVELRMAPLGEAVHLFGVGAKLRDGRFEADAKDKKQLAHLFDSLTWWGEALQTARLADAIVSNHP
jgi:NAD(P)H-dependent FMN reductase